MKTKEQIEQQLKALESDERLKEEPALVQINAPLALIQVSIKAKIQTLRWVLKEEST